MLPSIIPDKENETDRIKRRLASSELHFQDVIECESLDGEDFDIKHQELEWNANPPFRNFHQLNLKQTKNQSWGFTIAERTLGLDLAPHLKLEYLDDHFLPGQPRRQGGPCTHRRRREILRRISSTMVTRFRASWK